MSEAIPEFGAREPGVTYRLRPGGYIVLRRETGEIAAVATDEGIFLPGGGVEAGESVEEAAIREAYEECGFRVAILSVLGVADEFVRSREDGVHYRKRCSFFRARLEGQDDRREAGHELVWLDAAECGERLTLGCDRWAVDRPGPDRLGDSRTGPGTGPGTR